MMIEYQSREHGNEMMVKVKGRDKGVGGGGAKGQNRKCSSKVREWQRNLTGMELHVDDQML